MEHRFRNVPDTYDSVADRSGEYFRELTNYSAVAVRIQGKAEVGSRHEQPFSCRVLRAFHYISAISNYHTHCCSLQKLVEDCNLGVI
jgi:hypothetical protein